MPKFTIYTDKNDEFRWKFVSSTEAVIARSSEGHKTKDACIASVSLLQKDIVGATVDPTVMAVTGQKAVVRGAPAPAASASSPKSDGPTN